MSIFWKTILLLSALDLIQCRKDSKLLFIQIMYRHGDRAPHRLYPTDPNPEYLWPEGLGKLTKLGKYQHYSLGKFLRLLYRDFVTSNPTEVTIDSSVADRCLSSALSNTASFYAPTPEWTFDADIHWQPIPVHYKPKKKDKYLVSQSHCPAYKKEMKRIIHSDEVRTFLEDNKEMLNYLSKHSGENVYDILTILKLIDTLHVENKYNFKVPLWAYSYWDKYDDLLELIYNWLISTPTLLRLRAGPVIGKIIEEMKGKINGELPDTKVKVYSTHESKIFGVLRALQFFDVRPPPPYCSTIIFELHERKNGQHAVRLVYLNSTTPEDVFQVPHVLTLNGCTEYCPLDQFIHHTKYIIPEDWKKECEVGTQQFSSMPDYEEKMDEEFFKELEYLMV